MVASRWRKRCSCSTRSQRAILRITLFSYMQTCPGFLKFFGRRAVSHCPFVSNRFQFISSTQQRRAMSLNPKGRKYFAKSQMAQHCKMTALLRISSSVVVSRRSASARRVGLSATREPATPARACGFRLTD
jgi:hypothetical protein